MNKKIFKFSESPRSTLYPYSDKECRVLRVLTDSENETETKMFEVQFEDGFICHAYEDELIDKV